MRCWARREERDIRDRSMEALRFVGLGGIAAMRAGALAYGHRRLLEIARAIVARGFGLLVEVVCQVGDVRPWHTSATLPSRTRGKAISPA
jgi:ABC-type uncharacterized transport system ATPase subunit